MRSRFDLLWGFFKHTWTLYAKNDVSTYVPRQPVGKALHNLCCCCVCFKCYISVYCFFVTIFILVYVSTVCDEHDTPLSSDEWKSIRAWGNISMYITHTTRVMWKMSVKATKPSVHRWVFLHWFFMVFKNLLMMRWWPFAWLNSIVCGWKTTDRSSLHWLLEEKTSQTCRMEALDDQGCTPLL